MKAEISAPEDAFRWAEGFTNLETGKLPFDKRNYRLDRMRALLELLGNPQAAYRIVHVAGTKGKGSTAALIASVLDASGEKTGLYTSPHVATPLERITVSGAFPGRTAFVELARDLSRRIDGLRDGSLPGGFRPTTFELYTLLAFLSFRAEGCAAAVIETGIGGRLDATNVVSPVASVITPLDLEHTEILGDTIEKIAEEKAGIIKSGAPVYIGLQPGETREVFRRAASINSTTAVFLDEELDGLDASIDAAGTTARIALKGAPPGEFRLSLLGRFQAENAALAYLALTRSFPGIPRGAYAEGFLKASLPGRMEVLRRPPPQGQGGPEASESAIGDGARVDVRGGTPPRSAPIVLDGAHTPLAVRRLMESFSEIFPGDAVLLFGSVAGKKPEEMARILAPAFRRIVVSTPGTFKESDPEAVAKIFKNLNPGTILVKDPREALRAAEEAAGYKLPILVTGSFYMIAEIRRLVRP